MNRRRRRRRGGTGSTAAKTEDIVETQETGADGAESLETTVPMVYDGYYGDFVPVEHASFDVSTTPDAVVRLPRPPQPASDNRTRRRGPAGPRCDACGVRRRGVRRTRDQLLAVCGACAQGADVGRLDAAAAIVALVQRSPEGRCAALLRRLSRRRMVWARRRDRQHGQSESAPS